MCFELVRVQTVILEGAKHIPKCKIANDQQYPIRSNGRGMAWEEDD